MLDLEFGEVNPLKAVLYRILNIVYIYRVYQYSMFGGNPLSQQRGVVAPFWVKLFLIKKSQMIILIVGPF